MLKNRAAAKSLKPQGKSQAANHEKMPIETIHQEDYMSCTDMSTKRQKKSKKQNFHPSSSARQRHGSGEGTENELPQTQQLIVAPAVMIRRAYPPQ